MQTFEEFKAEQLGLNPALQRSSDAYLRQMYARQVGGQASAANLANTSNATSVTDLPIAVALRVLAWIEIVAGLLGGIWLWNTIGYVANQDYSSIRNPSPVGIGISLAVILQGIIVGTLFLAASIAINDLRSTRDHLSALVQRQKNS